MVTTRSFLPPDRTRSHSPGVSPGIPTLITRKFLRQKNVLVSVHQLYDEDGYLKRQYLRLDISRYDWTLFHSGILTVITEKNGIV